MPSPPDPRPQRPGLSQIGEAVTGNLAQFYANGQVEDSGISATLGVNIPDSDLLGGDASDFTSVTVGSGLTLSAGTLSADVQISGLTLNTVPRSAAGGASLVNSAIVDDGATVTLSRPLVAPTGTPASAAATGKAGTIVWDASFIYVCVATNTWKRIAIATW